MPPKTASIPEGDDFSWRTELGVKEELPDGKPIEMNKVTLFRGETKLALLEVYCEDPGEAELTWTDDDGNDCITYVYGKGNLGERLVSFLGLSKTDAAAAVSKFPDGVL